ncbi:MAG: ion channel [Candidatus Cyclobacteriaceae bacterium M3_2C_046]
MQLFYLILGLLVLLVVSFDFFYTTLSGSGASFLTYAISALAHKWQMLLFRFFGRRIFKLSGMFINLSLLISWVILIWLGLFLIFSSNPEAIINSQGKMASSIERLYFTGYVLSTLGVGNLFPSTPFFQVVTSVFSFFGFIFFTLALTYLISVFSAIMHKRSLSLFLNKLGDSPSEAANLLTSQEPAFTYQQILALQNMIEVHSAHHQAYPVLHYYINSDKPNSLSINLTILDEAISIILTNDKEKTLQKELMPLRKSISQFLKHLQSKYHILSDPDRVAKIDWKKLELPSGSLELDLDEGDLHKRRRILDSLLATEGYSWKHVYPRKDIS